MASFNDLPWKILRQITEQLSRKSLNSLVQTNKFFERFLTDKFHDSRSTHNRGRLPTLCWAVMRGRHELVCLLLGTKGVDVNIQDREKGRTPLHQAARHGHKDILISILSTCPLLNLQDKTYQTPLHRAALGGHEMIIKILASGDLYLDPVDDNGRSPLQYAIRCGPKVIKELMLKMGIDSIWTLPQNLRMDIWKTVVERRDKAIKALLDKGANVYSIDRDGFTPLHHLISILDETEEEADPAESLGISTLKLLFGHGATNIMEKKERTGGNTPLHMATMYGFVSIVRFLVEEGADLEARNQDGDAPLHIATKGNGERGMYEIFKLLIENGAKTDAQDTLARTPLHCAALFKEGDIRMVITLLRSMTDVECRDRGGNTALHFAVLNRSFEIARMVLDAGVNVDSQNFSLQTALHMAIVLGDHDIVQLLLENEADIKIRDDREQTALEVALSKCSEREGNLDIVSELLRRGASVTSKAESSGRTALHTAVWWKELGGAKLLLEKGADFNAKDANGITPFNLAQQRADIEMVRLLTKAKEKADEELRVRNLVGW